MEFIVFPAIDLSGGKVVRLKEGDPHRQTTYSADPTSTARAWLGAGARWLHVVNLDGAFDRPDAANRQALRGILDAAAVVQARVQFGGGLRTLQAVEAALDLGVARVMLGTLAVEQPDRLGSLVARWGVERIGASLDARDGLVRVRGWQQGSELSALEAAFRLRDEGLEWLAFTDIRRDGLQTGLNLAATQELSQQTGMKVIASGGVRGAEDVRAARVAGLAGVIVGRALYEGTIKLEEVI